MIHNHPYVQFCDQNVETTLHLLYECKVVKKIWSALETWLSSMHLTVNLPAVQIILNLYNGEFHSIINTVITVVKQYIYVKKCLKEDISFIGMLPRVINYRKTEGLIAHKNNKMARHIKKWKDFIL